MTKRIMIIQGHPDTAQIHLCHALENAYLKGAQDGGHEVRSVNVADLDFPLLRTAQEFTLPPPESLQYSIDSLRWADHIVIIYPLWLGTMPALLKGYLEQLFRPGVALQDGEDSKWPKGKLTGKSCRIILTMGMPALAYKWFFLAHSLKSLERNVLKLSGIKPIRETILGMVEVADEATKQKWFATLEQKGSKAT